MARAGFHREGGNGRPDARNSLAVFCGRLPGLPGIFAEGRPICRYDASGFRRFGRGVFDGPARESRGDGAVLRGKHVFRWDVSARNGGRLPLGVRRARFCRGEAGANRPRAGYGGKDGRGENTKDTCLKGRGGRKARFPVCGRGLSGSAFFSGGWRFLNARESAAGWRRWGRQGLSRPPP